MADHQNILSEPTDQEIIDAWREYWNSLQEVAPLHASDYEVRQEVHPFCECPFCWNLRKQESAEDE